MSKVVYYVIIFVIISVIAVWNWNSFYECRDQMMAEGRSQNVAMRLCR